MYKFVLVFVSLLLIHSDYATTSPISTYTNYTYSTELQADIAYLWWSVDERQQEIVFELHIKTTGWIALGISPAGGMTGADIGVGWVDNSGQLHFQDRYATETSTPQIDSTTVDWFGLQGREENGWTAIQFKRPLDSCDSMDTPITSGTNILIFAYGLDDPVGNIEYHGTRRGSRIIPLRSYNNPPPESKFAGLDYFDFKLDNYAVPIADTTYHCKVYRVPENITERRHNIAQYMMIDRDNLDIVHHLLVYECDSSAVFDDDNLPDDECDNIKSQTSRCMTNIAFGWAVGADYMVEFPEIAGYAVGGDTEVKYLVIQTHYDNPKGHENRTDSSGIRFYLGNELRQYDIGYLGLGAEASVPAIAIPPGVERFVVDAYCTVNATKDIPESGITVFSAFPHTHLQGRTVWTKLIRNRTAQQYLFDADSFQFNYQFENRLPSPIKLYPGDELATRCIYNTMDKNEITLGGEGTREEMCLHVFMYYPRVNTMCACFTRQSNEAWMQVMNSSTYSYGRVEAWLKNQTWTEESKVGWQEFYNNASRYLGYGRSHNQATMFLPKLPEYEDLPPAQCKRIVEETTIATATTNIFVTSAAVSSTPTTSITTATISTTTATISTITTTSSPGTTATISTITITSSTGTTATISTTTATISTITTTSSTGTTATISTTTATISTITTTSSPGTTATISTITITSSTGTTATISTITTTSSLGTTEKGFAMKQRPFSSLLFIALITLLF